METTMEIDLGGRVALVSGAGAGIGAVSAQEFAAAGATVAVVDMNLAAAQATVDKIAEAGGTAAAFECNITSEEQVTATVAAIVERFGSLDCAFNNAGIGPDGVRIPYGPLVESDAATWRKICEVNLTGTFLCVKHELIQMMKQGAGSIVNAASIGGVRMAPGFGAYGPSKAGVIALTELAALEAAPTGVRVNVVAPGPCGDTTLMANTLASDPGQDKMLEEHVIPLKKLARPIDIARAAIWLCSDLAGHTTGQRISVDGGMHVA